MITYDKFQLENGLRVIVHKDTSTPVAAVNILYDVGARDEDENKTGFAHLFEHLMFGGSVNIPNYDSPLQMAGGENNAFTSNDITNYYITLPANNLETAFWLESDRMLSLAFSEKSLEVQRNVVIEEFNQRYLNQPYGDVWLLLRPLCYKVHPYKWNTIGKNIQHIEDVKMEDVKSFFKKFYCPDNAVLVVAGNVETDEVKQLCKKWFEPIPRGNTPKRNLPQEPVQTEKRFLEVERKVPVDAIYKTYHIGKRTDENFYTVDIISEILSRGNSSRLYQKLVKEQKIFSEIDAYHSGDLDEGLFIFSGKPAKGVSLHDAEPAINSEIENIKTEIVSERELQKVKNKIESTFVFSEMSVLNKAMTLALFELLGDAAMINSEIKKYLAVTPEKIQKVAKNIFTENNSSVLYYRAAK